jgi:hypothetical protein
VGLLWKSSSDWMNALNNLLLDFMLIFGVIYAVGFFAICFQAIRAFINSRRRS